MATYPTLPTEFGGDPTPESGLQIDRAEDGTARARAYGGDRMKITIRHPWLTSAQKSTLDAFYSSNRLIPFDYTSVHDGVTRSCLFASGPKYKREFGDYWTASVEMVEA